MPDLRTKWEGRAMCPLTRSNCYGPECALMAKSPKGLVCGLSGRGRLRVLIVNTERLGSLDRLVYKDGRALYE